MTTLPTDLTSGEIEVGGVAPANLGVAADGSTRPFLSPFSLTGELPPPGTDHRPRPRRWSAAGRPADIPADHLSTLGFQSVLQHFIHLYHAPRRAFLIHTFSRSDNPARRRQADRLRDCCRFGYLASVEGASAPRQFLSLCRNRLCPFCSKALSARNALHVEAVINTMRHPSQLTLTVPSRPGPLASHISDLLNSFRRFRRTKLWRRHVRCGYWFLEITLNLETQLWHPHVHVVMDADYVSQAILQDAWSTIVGVRSILWIERVRNSRDAARELAKYATKPAAVQGYSENQVLQLATSLHGRTLMHGFGKVPKLRPDEDLDSASLPKLTYTVNFGSIRSLTDRGFPIPRAVAALSSIIYPHLHAYYRHALMRDSLHPYAPIGNPAVDRILRRLPPGPGRPLHPRRDLRRIELALVFLLLRVQTQEAQGLYSAPHESP